MTESSIFSPTTYNHIGVFVENLEEGINAYARLLGLEFRPPVSSSLAALEQRGYEETATQVRLAFSVNGPPYYELIEMTGSGIYAPHHNVPGFHHVSVWLDEDEMMSKIQQDRTTITAIFWAPDGAPRACYEAPTAPAHLRIEYLNRNLKSRFEHLWATGKLPD